MMNKYVTNFAFNSQTFMMTENENEDDYRQYLLAVKLAGGANLGFHLLHSLIQAFLSRAERPGEEPPGQRRLDQHHGIGERHPARITHFRRYKIGKILNHNGIPGAAGRGPERTQN